jgi:hypothetical protein
VKIESMSTTLDVFGVAAAMAHGLTWLMELKM